MARKIRIFYMTPLDGEEEFSDGEIPDVTQTTEDTGRLLTDAVVRAGVWMDPKPGEVPEWIPGQWVTRVVFVDEKYPDNIRRLMRK